MTVTFTMLEQNTQNPKFKRDVYLGSLFKVHSVVSWLSSRNSIVEVHGGGQLLNLSWPEVRKTGEEPGTGIHPPESHTL